MRLAAGLLAALAVAGCASTAVPVVPAADRELVLGYFTAANAAAAQGPEAQRRFFTRTRHPDAPAAPCPPLEVLTVRTEPAPRTLRPDPDWPPRPRGTIYVIAGTVTAVWDGRVYATQIGSQHVVVLDGTAYGFPPCPA